MTTERSPGWKLFLAGIIGIALVIPLMMVYALNWDRQEQSNVAQNSIAAGWGGPQVVVGPVLVIPYTANSVETVDQNGRQTTRTVLVKKGLFLSPETNALTTNLKPDRKRKSIYENDQHRAGDCSTRGHKCVLHPHKKRTQAFDRLLNWSRSELLQTVQQASKSTNNAKACQHPR